MLSKTSYEDKNGFSLTGFLTYNRGETSKPVKIPSVPVANILPPRYKPSPLPCFVLLYLDGKYFSFACWLGIRLYQKRTWRNCKAVATEKVSLLYSSGLTLV